MSGEIRGLKPVKIYRRGKKGDRGVAIYECKLTEVLTHVTELWESLWPGTGGGEGYAPPATCNNISIKENVPVTGMAQLECEYVIDVIATLMQQPKKGVLSVKGLMSYKSVRDEKDLDGKWYEHEIATYDEGGLISKLERYIVPGYVGGLFIKCDMAIAEIKVAQTELNLPYLMSLTGTVNDSDLPKIGNWPKGTCMMLPPEFKKEWDWELWLITYRMLYWRTKWNDSIKSQKQEWDVKIIDGEHVAGWWDVDELLDRRTYSEASWSAVNALVYWHV